MNSARPMAANPSRGSAVNPGRSAANPAQRPQSRQASVARSSAAAQKSNLAAAKARAKAREKAEKKRLREERAKNPNRIRFWNLEGKADVPMMAIILILLVCGLTAMFSAGHALAYRDTNDSFYFIKHQAPAALLGLIGMFILMLFDYRFLRYEFKLKNGRSFTIAHILFAAMLVLNAMCLPFGVAADGGDQKRWLKIPVFGTFQPSDFLKVAVIIFLAYYIVKHKDVIRSFRYGLFQPGLMFLVLVLVLFVIQTHLSALLIVFSFSAVMLFVGGINVKPAIAMLAVAAVVLILAIQFSEFSYFSDRFKYMDPLSEPWKGSYQNYQSALALGSGGIWGKGFGNSTQKYNYLPEAQNDFVYSIWVEEFGLIGGLIVIIMFMFFIFRGFTVARHAEDRFGMLIATGITFQIGLQALLNIGVDLCCIPNTGISLPFFSYGGTALMIQLWEMGLLLSVSKRSKLR